MKRLAVLVDGEFFSLTLRRTLGLGARPTAEQTHRNALVLCAPDEEVLRVYYYDSQPFEGYDTHPMTGQQIDYRNTAPAVARRRFLSELGQMNLVALRCGQTKPRGWSFTDAYLRRIKAGGVVPPPTPADYEQRFEQKGVDMRIGIDVATLALNRYVDRIAVISNDTDLIPAFKVARRHGVQVAITQIGNVKPHRELIEDSDFLRLLQPTA